MGFCWFLELAHRSDVFSYYTVYPDECTFVFVAYMYFAVVNICLLVILQENKRHVWFHYLILARGNRSESALMVLKKVADKVSFQSHPAVGYVIAILQFPCSTSILMFSSVWRRI